jgi:hypothetical protein
MFHCVNLLCGTNNYGTHYERGYYHERVCFTVLTYYVALTLMGRIMRGVTYIMRLCA